LDRDKPKVLVVDDEDIIRVSCRRILAEAGYEVKTAKDGSESIGMLAKEGFDVVLTDLRMPDMDGLEVLRNVKEQWPDTEVIIITGYSTVPSAVSAMKHGAFDYIEKPFTPEGLLRVAAKAVEKKKLLIESIRLRRKMPGLYRLETIIGSSAPIQRVFQAIASVAPTDGTVLITGESGTGKELVAKAVHYNSLRKDRPFVVVDCGTIPDGLMESELFGYTKGAFTGATENKDGLLKLASGGTLFFDEIGNLAPATQAKLLRVIQEKEFRPLGAKNTLRLDLRIIAATNRDIEAMTRDGSFREDLFYRLNVFSIKLPPLRERKEDIPLLIFHFLEKYDRQHGKEVRHISAEAMQALMSASWPGNIRQLENTIERAVILATGNTLMPHHVTTPAGQDATGAPKSLGELRRLKKDLRYKSTEEVEKAFILDALKRNDWNITKAAADVGMQRTNFHALLRKYNISKTV